MNIETIVADRLKEMVESGSFKETVEKHLEKCVEGAISDAFRSFGKAGQEIKTAVENALALDASRLSIDEYHLFVRELVGQATRDFLKEGAQERYQTMLAEMFNKPPKEITVQQIIDPFLEEWRDDPCACDMDETAYLTVKESHGSYFREFKLYNQDPEEKGRFHSKPDPELEFFIWQRDNRFCVPRRLIYGERPSLSYQQDARIFQMYAAQTVVTDGWTVDPDDLDLHIRDY